MEKFAKELKEQNEKIMNSFADDMEKVVDEVENIRKVREEENDTVSLSVKKSFTFPLPLDKNSGKTMSDIPKVEYFIGGWKCSKNDIESSFDQMDEIVATRVRQEVIRVRSNNEKINKKNKS